MDTSFNGSNFGSASYLANPGTSDWGNYGSGPQSNSNGYGSEWSDPAFYNPNNAPLPWLKQGATDAQIEQATGIKNLIRRLQRELNVQGRMMGSSLDLMEVTGIFDGPTVSGVRDFQEAQKIDIDGEVGPQTYKKLGWPDKVAKASKAKVQATSAVVVTEAMAPLEWYNNNWYRGAIVLTVLAVGGILFWPKRK